MSNVPSATDNAVDSVDKSLDEPKTIYLKDYQVPNFLIHKTHLTFELSEEQTRVTSTLTLERNPQSENLSPLVLLGQDMVLESVAINGRVIRRDDYQVTDNDLTLVNVPDAFELTCVTLLKPQENTSLEGLYKSHTMFCTQCEAEGFRKITYYLDRPDAMSEFTTKIIADKEKYPILLSNGNPVEEGDLEDNRHYAVWHDPFMKPCYLFALVAGDLQYVEDYFTTMNNRSIRLRIYVEPKDLNKCDHAMLSLKNSMKWDEDVYGREYDLDIFNIVAVDDFNMGAMENKGLNIFNTSCVLANPATTTDAAFQRVEGVVAHEYFHNWSGNRVTCRDWFQLSLKEGFTVFRDAEFSADMNSATVKRVEDVILLKTLQFAEDAGPMAHAVQPDSYIEINNFYTLTIYEKGAEVVRMIHTLLGPELFREGSDEYFARNDGKAATIEDFVACMEDVSGRDLTQFKRWYKQAGTPYLKVEDDYNPIDETYTLSFKQSCRVTPECDEKKPYVIPVAVGLLGDGGDLPLTIKGEEPQVESSDNTHRVIELTKPEERITFTNIKEKPVPSLLRGFSAPVNLHFQYNREELAFLMARDTDGFNRWDASQKLATDILLELVKKGKSRKSAVLDSILADAYKAILSDPSLDKAMVALMLKLPSEAALHQEMDVVDIEAIHESRNILRQSLADTLEEEFKTVYLKNQTDAAFEASAEQVAQRSLKNLALSYLCLTGKDEYLFMAQEQFKGNHNMTDVMAALNCLVNSGAEQALPMKQSALADFYDHWQVEALVVNQWLTVQATCELEGGLDRVKELLQHASFSMTNPNKIRAVIGAFCMNNHVNFHRADGAGYEFLADQVIALNETNPQIASRLLTPLTKWRRFDSTRQGKICDALKRIKDAPNLSPDVFEVVNKSLV
ncbi:MAG: aminopeptidase N [Cellvibrionaceae bacterium]